MPGPRAKVFAVILMQTWGSLSAPAHLWECFCCGAPDGRSPALKKEETQTRKKDRPHAPLRHRFFDHRARCGTARILGDCRNRGVDREGVFCCLPDPVPGLARHRAKTRSVTAGGEGP